MTGSIRLPENEVTSRFNRLRDRWRDPSLTMLLVCQCIAVFGVVPANASGISLPPSLIVGLLIALVTFATVMSRGRWTLIAGVVTMLLGGLAVSLEARRTGFITPAIVDLVGVTIFVLLSTVVFQAIFRPGRFTGHRILGAFSLYLNIGLMFTFLHRLVAELLPGAYANLPASDQGAAFRAAAVYFSFSSLTSVGYGDIVPVQPIARSLAMLESMIGQLLPATLLARVVTLAMKARDE